MTLRRSARLVAVALAFVLVSGCDRAGRRRPSVLVIITDDQRWDQLDDMPAVQNELVASGVRFTNSFVSTSQCCPSRASTLTGQYAHTTGVLSSFITGADGSVLKESSTLATWLRGAGYRTGFFGKYMNSYGPKPYVPVGWDDWRAFRTPEFFDYQLVENGTPVRYGRLEAEYSTDVLAAHATRFIRAADDRPFFVWFAPFAPHLPATPAPRHAQRFTDLAPWRPPSYDEEDVTDKPGYFQRTPRLSPEAQERIDETRRLMLASLLAVDEAVASLMAAVRETGGGRDTIVVFTSDNGFLLGEHRLLGKQYPYQASVRVPLVIRYPALVSGPREEGRFVLNVDLAPTIAELAGVQPAHTVEGASLVPLLTGAAVRWRTDVLTEHWGAMAPITYGAVRDARWRYVEYVGGGSELYDLTRDPDELTNVAADPGMTEVRERLAARLRELHPYWPWRQDRSLADQRR